MHPAGDRVPSGQQLTRGEPRMRKLISIALLSTCMAFAQTTVTSTTLSSALSYTSTTVRVASATGIAIPSLPSSAGDIGSPSSNDVTIIYADREAMRVVGVSGTIISVQRGFGGTLQSAHISGAKVWVGPGSYFYSTAPEGACTSTGLTSLPRIITTTGDLYTCGNGQWTTFGTYENRLTQGATLASATTITPTNPIHVVSGTTEVVTITVPPACQSTGCQLILIPSGNFTTTASGGNVGLASTAVTSKTLTMTYVPSTGKWYPSY